MHTKGAIGNLINRYRAVLKKCNLINTFGSLAVAGMMVMGTAGMAVAEDVSIDTTSKVENSLSAGTKFRGYEKYGADGATYNITNDANISVTYDGGGTLGNDTFVEGIRTNNSDFNFKNVTVTVNNNATDGGTYSTSAADKKVYSTGIYATNDTSAIDSTITINGNADISVTTSGLRAVGIKTSSPELIVKGDTNVTATSGTGDAYGIATQYTGKFVSEGDVTTTARAGGEARAISVQPYSNDTGNLELKGDVTAVAEGKKAFGVRAFGTNAASGTEGSVAIGSADSVINISAKSTSEGAFGMAVEEGAVLALNGKDATIAAESESGRVAGLLLFGVQSGNQESTIEAPLTVTAKGTGTGNTDYVDGIRINEMKVDFSNTVNVDVDNAGTGQTVGVFVTNNGTGSSAKKTTFANGATVDVDTKQATNGAYGLVVSAGDSAVDVTGGQLKVDTTNEGGFASAVVAQGISDESVLTVAEGVTSELKAKSGTDEAYGLWVNGSNATLSGATTVTAEGKTGARGIRVEEYDDSGTTSHSLNITNDLTVKAVATAGDARGVEVHGKSTAKLGASGKTVDITAQGNGSGVTIGLLDRANGGKIDVYGDTLKVQASNSGNGWAYGILSQGNNDSATTLTVESENTEVTVDAADPTKASGILAFSKATLSMTKNVKVNAADGEGDAIVARGDSQVTVGSEDSTVQLDGNIRFADGGATSGTGIDADVTVTLAGEESYLKGNILKSATGTGTVDGMRLKLLNGGSWTSDEESFVNELTSEGGVMTLASDHTVNVDNMNGTGGDVNFTKDKLGQLIVNNVTSNSGTELNVGLVDDKLNKLSADDVTEDDLKAARERVKGAPGTTTLPNGLTVTASAEEGFVYDAITVDASGNASGGGTSPVLEAVNEMASFSTVALDRILTNDVRKRLGDIRSDKKQSGVWMRWDGGRLKGSSSLTTDFNAVQIGADSKFGFSNTRFGIAASFIHGDSDHKRVDADLEGFSFAGYATWMGDNGMFADVVARISSMDTEMQAKGEEAKLDSIVTSLSGEFGWRFDICQQFYVEPQAELAYTYVKSDDLQFSTARFDIDDMDSLMGRVGVAAGWKLPNDLGDVYARVSVVQQFLGDAKVTASSGVGTSVYKTDGDDTWVEYGIGANVKLTDNTYIWADVERTEGAKIDEEWRGTVGFRFSF